MARKFILGFWLDRGDTVPYFTHDHKFTQSKCMAGKFNKIQADIETNLRKNIHAYIITVEEVKDG